MKWVIWCVIGALVLGGCGAPEEIVPCVAEGELAALEGDMAGAEGLALQENLALWYNRNLLEENDPDLREAYGTILFFSDGMMGSVEIPGIQLHLPIYHGPAGEKGFGHDPDSAFPIGGTGNHPVLVTEKALTLAVGDTFLIHILGRTLTYQVAAIRDDRDTTPAPEADYCSILTSDGTQYLGLRAADIG